MTVIGNKVAHLPDTITHHSARDASLQKKLLQCCRACRLSFVLEASNKTTAASAQVTRIRQIGETQMASIHLEDRSNPRRPLDFR
jgi:hypothetical protein